MDSSTGPDAPRGGERSAGEDPRHQAFRHAASSAAEGFRRRQDGLRLVKTSPDKQASPATAPGLKYGRRAGRGNYIRNLRTTPMTTPKTRASLTKIGLRLELAGSRRMRSASGYHRLSVASFSGVTATTMSPRLALG